MNATSPFITLVSACVGVLTLLAVVGVPVHYAMPEIRRRSEMRHAERMKALELGRSLPAGDAWPALTCIAIGAGVPASIALFSWLASVMMPPRQGGGMGPGEGIAFWGTPMGIVAVICGTILTGRWLRSRGQSRREDAPAPEKAALDPDSFDVVGRRG